MSIEALDRAIGLFPTQQAFAAAIGIKSPSVSEWRKKGRVPADRCPDIEAATNGAVSRADLRPDLFAQSPNWAAATAAAAEQGAG